MKIKCPCGAEYEIAAMPENDSPRTVERLEADNEHLHCSLGKYIEQYGPIVSWRTGEPVDEDDRLLETLERELGQERYARVRMKMWRKEEESWVE